jgi:D-xylose transport system substrate-binding protein
VHRSSLTRALVCVGVSAVFAGGVAACGSSDDSGTGSGTAASTAAASSGTSTASGGSVGKVAVLLPDTQSSVRWETADKPLLQKAFDDAGVPVEIQNAQGDKSTQQQQAEQAITNGAKVLLLVNLDSGSGAAIEANAASQGVKTIDYDRLTLGGSADYYVSFNNVTVGELQGKGLVDCLNAKGGSGVPNIAELNGSPTDNNATLFAQGYNSVLNPLYKDGKLKKAADQSVPDWDNQQALTIYEQMLQKTNNNIQGVLAANDGLANSVISAQKQRKLPQVPVTGQDATAQGIQNILAGDQCMTVYKAIKGEADAASKLAISLAKKQPAPAGLINGKSNDGKRDVPSVLLTPVAVTKDNIKDTVIADGFLKPSDICVGKYAKLCTEAGIS